jgi:hypothetical protein
MAHRGTQQTDFQEQKQPSGTDTGRLFFLPAGKTGT